MLCFMSVKRRLYLKTCIFVYKALNGLLPKYISEKIRIGESVDMSQARQADDIRITFRRTKNAQKSIFYD